MASLMNEASKSQLAIIDVQTKLCGVMPTVEMQAVTKNITTLLQAANRLAVPVVATEQYPQALGATVAEIAQYFLKVKPIAKTAFSACAEPKFKAQCQRDRSHIVLVGLEAHICVLHPAMALLAQQKQVFVVADAVISRQSLHHGNALTRLANAGCIVTNTESVLFEWLSNANHEAFKDLSRLIK